MKLAWIVKKSFSADPPGSKPYEIWFLKPDEAHPDIERVWPIVYAEIAEWNFPGEGGE